jgi:hypothetical protein
MPLALTLVILKYSLMDKDRNIYRPTARGRLRN